jgi:Domain of unknown function (DUF397)
MSSDTPWIKATASGGSGGNCLELRQCADTVEVRDSKAGGTGPALRFTPSEFAAWIRAAKNGELDHLR